MKSLFNTLGVLQYRLGNFEEAIVSCNKSIELRPAETGNVELSAWALGVLAMCNHRLGNIEKAAELRTQFLVAAASADVVLRRVTQSLLREVQTTFEPDVAFPESASIDEFHREATFEDLLQHHWQFSPHESDVASFSLVSEGAHEGVICLQAHIQNGPVTAYQTVTVEPNTTYRLSGWIRYDLLPKEPAAESTPAVSDQTEPATAKGATVTDSPSEQSTFSFFGASIGLRNRRETSLERSEVIFATTDWKQVILEFTTTENEITVSPGFLLDLEGQQISGTAWFDDLKLEKVE